MWISNIWLTITKVPMVVWSECMDLIGSVIGYEGGPSFVKLYKRQVEHEFIYFTANTWLLKFVVSKNIVTV